MYAAVCSNPSAMVRSRLPCSTLHSTTCRSTSAVIAAVRFRRKSGENPLDRRLDPAAAGQRSGLAIEKGSARGRG